MAESWTRLSPEGNIISVTEPISEHAHFEVYPSHCKMQSTVSAFYSPIISSHLRLERLLVTARYQIRHQNKHTERSRAETEGHLSEVTHAKRRRWFWTGVEGDIWE